jgi:hypothetical protein
MHFRRLRATSTLLFVIVAAALVGVAPVNAAERDVSSWRSSEPCAGGAWCLYYRAYAEGAQYNHIGSSSEIRYASAGGPTFRNGGATRGSEGVGQQVRNNAASLNNRTDNRSVSSFYSPNYSGNSDRVQDGWAGNLYYTANNQASVRINW